MNVDIFHTSLVESRCVESEVNRSREDEDTTFLRIRVERSAISRGEIISPLEDTMYA